MGTKLYRYRESGLDNVYLVNGYTRHRTPYGAGVAVQDVDGLHRLIALHLVEKPGRLTGKELRFLRSFIGLPQTALARQLGIKDQTVSLWERHGRVPQTADVMVRMLVTGALLKHRKVTDFLKTVQAVDRLVHEKIVATESNAVWAIDAQVEDAEEVA